MKILSAQLNPIIGDILGNKKKVLEALDAGRKQGVDIVTFPEMTLCGYAPEDLVLHTSFIEEMENALDEIVKNSSGISVIVGLVRKNPARDEKSLLNSAAVISDGKLLGFHDKWLLPTYDVFDERRYFARGKQVNVFHIKGMKIGVVICEDMWQNAGEEISGTSYPIDPVKELVIYKPDILFNLTASPFQSRKADIRVQVCRAAAKTLKCPVVYTCQVGANGSVIFDGYSLFVDKEGNLKQVAKGFQEDYMIIDLHSRGNTLSFDHDPMYDMFAALKLGVHDYFLKSHQKKAIIGLSGGIDSALVAVITKEAIGSENVLGIYMPTRYSSKESYEDAKKLAENLNIEFKVIDIDPLFDHYLSTLHPYFVEYDEDVTEENIQARIRGNVLMAFSNKFKALLLATGNKSELALGYCTLYGDMCGALCVIGDLLKTECYQIAAWINREKEIIPNRTLEKAPSAELRHGQKDSDSLPPYEIIDKVIRGYVEDYHTIEEISRIYKIEEEMVRFIVRRIYRAEHKRRQVAPSLRISKKSFTAGRRKPLHFSGSLEEKVY
jgi:NAD+ synthase (glutamine-hydrolysing)